MSASNWEEVYRVQTARIAELEATLDEITAANERASKRWQAAHPGKELVIPDQAKMVQWLLDTNAWLLKDKHRLDWLDSVGCWLTIPGHTKNNIWCWGASREVIDSAREGKQ